MTHCKCGNQLSLRRQAIGITECPRCLPDETLFFRQHPELTVPGNKLNAHALWMACPWVRP